MNREVECPNCGEVKTATGIKQFKHCGSMWKIEDNLADGADPSDENQQGNNNQSRQDPEEAFSTESDNSGNQQSKGGSSQGDSNQEDTETVNHCGGCGESFTGEPDNCPHCGAKLDWSRTIDI